MQQKLQKIAAVRLNWTYFAAMVHRNLKKKPVHKTCNRMVVCIYIPVYEIMFRQLHSLHFLFFPHFFKKNLSFPPPCLQSMWADIPPHLSLQLMSLI